MNNTKSSFSKLSGRAIHYLLCLRCKKKVLNCLIKTLPDLHISWHDYKSKWINKFRVSYSLPTIHFTKEGHEKRKTIIYNHRYFINGKLFRPPCLHEYQTFQRKEESLILKTLGLWNTKVCNDIFFPFSSFTVEHCKPNYLYISVWLLKSINQ